MAARSEDPVSPGASKGNATSRQRQVFLVDGGQTGYRINRRMVRNKKRDSILASSFAGGSARLRWNASQS